ncbi:hypothetical protein CLV90_3757 [Maribacter spongiicola]|uniref:Uncharacterized protein n=1 Tax=Maribacter spongiicola TaxID=1206753 RepID=A0A4R7JJM4_9FLAO|nr:hypothetical protein [Maribacter spongiicola]TDT37925.1 hypothetical protein CLV90_3757 [Maribacter spongiicola]
MKNDYRSNKFKKLLDNLQQESWQLELIISGFAIYGLIAGYDSIELGLLKSVQKEEGFTSFMLSILLTSMLILICVLLTHVVIRGLWIGAIGLRYVSGDIDYKNLNYSEKFTSFLKDKVGSFDHYISKLENICSTLFALAFLMIFYLISFFTVIGFYALSVYYLEGLEVISVSLHTTVETIYNTLYITCIIILVIDFLGAGFLKKYKWTSIIYYPIYRVFSYITLSFLYRPLVYNFLDQKKARWIGILMVPTYFVVTFFSSGFSTLRSNYLDHDQNTSQQFTGKENYEDQLLKDTDMVNFASIPSKIIEKSYLPIFISYTNYMEDAVFKNDSTLLPEVDERGFGFHLSNMQSASGVVNFHVTPEDNLEIQSKYLKIFDSIFKVQIDSKKQINHFNLTKNKQEQFGFETILDINELPRGKHFLRIIGPDEKEKGVFERDTLITIPFWYFPENSSTSNIQNSSIHLDSITSN